MKNSSFRQTRWEKGKMHHRRRKHEKQFRGRAGEQRCRCFQQNTKGKKPNEWSSFVSRSSGGVDTWADCEGGKRKILHSILGIL